MALNSPVEIQQTHDRHLILHQPAMLTNIAAIRQKLPQGCRLMLMAKANGYGLGTEALVRAALDCGVDAIGVAYVSEAVALREAGFSVDLLAIHATIPEVLDIVENEIQVAVDEIGILERLNEEAKRRQRPVKVHLKVNTGLNRFGCHPNDALSLAKKIESTPHLVLEGVMTHFAAANDPKEDPFTLAQIQGLDSVVAHLHRKGIKPPLVHAANSPGIMRFDLPQYNMARTTLSILGINPCQERSDHIPLVPAVSLTTRLVKVMRCHPEDTIGYGRTHRITTENARVAIIPFGYGDGLHRRYSRTGRVLIGGTLAPIVGNTCMDYTMIDISAVPQAKVGDSVVVIGADAEGNRILPETLAEEAGTIPQEFLACLGPRIHRTVTKG